MPNHLLPKKGLHHKLVFYMHQLYFDLLKKLLKK